jgi:glucose-6-phosphate 1-dehydrogenase
MNSPFILVIFGATGDLTARKLMPAIYRLVKAGEITQEPFIIGVGRRDITKSQFHSMMEESVRHAVKEDFDTALWKKIVAGIDYQMGLFEDAAVYNRLVTKLEAFDAKLKACVPRFFYLATPPEHYEVILKHLDGSKLAEGCGQGTTNYTKVLIEKPFGKDLETARTLDKLLASIFEERQIYRIDHYLGKETVQNLLAFRFANGIFEPTWNRNFIDHVQITLSEETGVGKRGAFYDGVGALRDVVQNHMLQMLAVTAMDQPVAFDATSIRDMRVKAMQTIELIGPEDVGKNVVRGQYEGYTGESHVDAASQTETYVALKVMLASERWKGVPFYLRTGKKLGKKVSEISLHYKKPIVCTGDLCLFPEPKVLRNVLAVRIEPNEGIVLRVMVKQPGLGMLDLTASMMHFTYREAFGNKENPDAYERLLLDSIRGDQTLFARTDEIETSWKLVTPLLDGCKNTQTPVYIYKHGAIGPREADALIEKDKRSWFLI